MNEYLLHVLWPHGSGMHVWLEKVAGHVVIGDFSDIPRSALPEPVWDMLTNKGRHSRARHQTQVEFCTPKGRLRRLRIPTVELIPDQAVDLLVLLAKYEASGSYFESESLLGLAADTQFLLSFTRGLDQLVSAGRVLFRLQYEADAWIPRWQPSAGLAERGWLASVNQQAPLVLKANGGSDFVDRVSVLIIDSLVRRRLASMPGQEEITQPLVRALLDGTALSQASGRMVVDVNNWRAQPKTGTLDLIFMVEEPPEEEPEEPEYHPDDPAGRLIAETGRAVSDSVPPVQVADEEQHSAVMPEASTIQGGIPVVLDETVGCADDVHVAPADLEWPLSLAYRSGSGAPHPIPFPVEDAVLRDRINEQMNVATKVWPPLNNYRYDETLKKWALTTGELVDFVQRGAKRLRDAGFRVLLPASLGKEKVKVKLSASPMTVAGPADSRLGIEELVQFSWSGKVGSTQLSDDEIQQLLDSSHDLVKIRGQWVQADTQVLRAVARNLEHLVDESGTGGTATVGELRAATDKAADQLRDEGVAGSIIGGEDSDEQPLVVEAASRIGSLLGTSEVVVPTRVSVPDSVTVELREYQRRGLDWLVWMADQGLGCVLADDMGLGKTLQTLAFLSYENERRGEVAEHRAALVVAPTSVSGNWVREAHRFVPGMRVYLHHGPQRLSGQELQEKIAESGVIVTTYTVLTKDIEEFVDYHFSHVILDEAQQVKNPGTKNAKAVRKVHADHRLALTGTPVENRLDELWAVMDFCNPGLFGDRGEFRNRYSIPIERHGDEDRTADLKALTHPFILRRVKSDPAIGSDLPEKSEVLLTCDLTAQQAALYQSVTTSAAEKIREASNNEADAERRGLVFALLTGLKQICNHPAQYLHDDSPFLENGKHRSGKMVVIEPIIDDALTSGRKVIIFTQFVAFGTMLQEHFQNRYGIDIPFLQGSVERKARDRMVSDFNSPEGPPMMILSLRAGGTGLNLTAASVVIHMDRWWNPAVENQATDRAYRIGQNRDVDVYKLVSKYTIEEKISDIIAGKMELATSVVGTGEAWITQLSDDELVELIALSEPTVPIRSEYTNARARHSLLTTSNVGTRQDLSSVPSSLGPTLALADDADGTGDAEDTGSKADTKSTVGAGSTAGRECREGPAGAGNAEKAANTEATVDTERGEEQP